MLYHMFSLLIIGCVGPHSNIMSTLPGYRSLWVRDPLSFPFGRFLSRPHPITLEASKGVPKGKDFHFSTLVMGWKIKRSFQDERTVSITNV